MWRGVCAQNIFIKEDGSLRLIDNEAALMNTWRNCGFDSVFVPTTQKQEIVRLTNAYVLKLARREHVPINRVDPQVCGASHCRAMRFGPQAAQQARAWASTLDPQHSNWLRALLHATCTGLSKRTALAARCVAQMQMPRLDLLRPSPTRTPPHP